ncbi:DEAD/DEAH box helicase [Desulfocurvus sp.]|uniref:DEAD/DEAH box helicase n=1 Tax=Desulfocurvus sp. TaxID=2871698 RepID=UPI0025C18EC3|nr:DEAD/DEAH box helicase [Desulfocurvus sp.]MCK9240815.1 DEAD/DEAH box helicase [Desulfocurvus sp.]
MINELINDTNIEAALQGILMELHSEGPVNPKTLEQLAYYKKFHSDVFQRFEKRIVTSMGLFYKIDRPSDIIEAVYSIFSDSIKLETGKSFTPVQAGVYSSIKNNKYVSFSAPTSAGKSYLFRELIHDATGDIVIIVPSRALISEYMNEILRLVGKEVLVLQFVDNINTAKTKRRIFILTPERGVEIFKGKDDFNIELFLMDEAQISEDKVRGLKFDSFVRRIDKVFPVAKKVFAHPFVENPEAQLEKHGFTIQAKHSSYNQQTVGKIFLFNSKNTFYLFSPNIECEPVPYGRDVAEEALLAGGTLLVYISKTVIYRGEHLLRFGKYVEMCPKIEDENAIKLIDKLKDFIGAKQKNKYRHSKMISMMERGVVVHHGSMPLRARLIIEEFIKGNYAKICFATATLNQGINMPFDVVWIDNFTNMDELTLKNLIGRAGRSTTRKNYFDYGYTILNKRNVKTFSERFKLSYKISNKSDLDMDITSVDEDLADIIEAIKEDSFDDEHHLTESQIERIEESDVDRDIELILDNLLVDLKPIKGDDYYKLGKSTQGKIKDSFKNIYIQHLRRSTLSSAEAAVLSAAIPILLWLIQGRSFSEIVSLRYSYLSQRDLRRELVRQTRQGKISLVEAGKTLDNTLVKWSPSPSPLPDSKLRKSSSFAGISINDLDFDTVVYDTYDYIDKTISLSITDPMCATFNLYFERTGDIRARAMSNFIRYGTNDELEIWLLRYGFGFEEIEWLKEHVVHVDSSQIYFNPSVETLSSDKLEMIERYL